MEDRHCPACNAAMIEGPESRGAWGCTACGGVWAGLGLSNQVASVLDPALRRLADAAQQNAQSLPRRRRVEAVGKPRPCPECHAQLQWRELAGVDIDVCAEHGTWFDRGELQRIADARVAKKAEPAPSTPLGHRVADLGADVALGSVRLFFAILFE